MSVSDSPDSSTASEEFQALKAFFPKVIQDLKSSFTSHEFIRELARLHQPEYVRALNRYIDDEKAPFQKLHGLISNALHRYPQLVEKLGDVDSVDIFGKEGKCAEWRKKDGA